MLGHGEGAVVGMTMSVNDIKTIQEFEDIFTSNESNDEVNRNNRTPVIRLNDF